MDASHRPTLWDTAEVADGFDMWDDTIGWQLGYPFVFEELRLARPEVRVLLDLGCGPGKVARRAAEDHGLQVHAVDTSPAMLALAVTRYGHHRVTCHQVTGPDLSFLGDASLDAAMSCFVFVCVPRREQARAMVAEVHRVLRPGGRFAVLNAHPGHTGVLFDSFRIGLPGAVYRAGDPMPVRLRRTSGEWMDIVDTYWSAETYHELLRDADFGRVWQTEPRPGAARRGAAPFLLVVGEK